ncbi:MAG: alkaline phosphatase family protein [Actinomycetota bacterium]|nr:alkaline phosphatase family protein [Actinomycetota bacterium]
MNPVSGLLPPPYGRRTLAEVVPSLLAALGAEEFDNALRITPARSVCLLVVDGLGWQLLRDHAADAPFLAWLMPRAEPLVAGFPATTATSLASLGTGLPPGLHGIVGYSFLVPGSGLINAVTWRAHVIIDPPDLREVVVPEQLQPAPTVLERAQEAGIAVILATPRYQEHSGLTRAVLRGGRFQPVRALGDLAATALSNGTGAFCYAYQGDLDMLGHRYGPGSLPWRLQLRQIDQLAASIAERLAPGALLAVTADHGMVTVAEADRVDWDGEPTLRDGVDLIGGEARVRHLYAKPGAADDVVSRWRVRLGDRALIVTREEAIAAGWFGPAVADHVRDRIGDVIVAAADSTGVVCRAAEPFESRLVGHHGSFTADEQLVPFLLASG